MEEYVYYYFFIILHTRYKNITLWNYKIHIHNFEI